MSLLNKVFIVVDLKSREVSKTMEQSISKDWHKRRLKFEKYSNLPRLMAREILADKIGALSFVVRKDYIQPAVHFHRLDPSEGQISVEKINPFQKTSRRKRGITH